MASMIPPSNLQHHLFLHCGGTWDPDITWQLVYLATHGIQAVQETQVETEPPAHA